MSFMTLADLCQQHAIAGRRVLIRADLNVPLDEAGTITEDTRVRASLEAIHMALQAGAAAVLVMSHLGRPKEGGLMPQDSLAPVAQRLSELLGQAVRLEKNWLQGPVHAAFGEVVLLENVRGNQGEKANDAMLAKQIAAQGDVFVHDAFGAAHRAQASTYGVAQYAHISCAGPLLTKEKAALDRALCAPEKPLLAIVGGSKVSSKLQVLETLSNKVELLIVGGGIANTFMLAAGLPVGKSLVEESLVSSAQRIMNNMRERGAEVPLPEDVVTAKHFSPDAVASVKKVHDVEADDLILDVGPSTIARFSKVIALAKTIVWNGPVGVFEWPAFSKGTEALAYSVAHASAFSIAGGGDTLAAIAQYGVGEQVDYISTGGGAFLEVLEGKELPAFEVLRTCLRRVVK